MGEQRTAFVLAGGGTKGAFEVGAVTYLVSERSCAPRSTSGSHSA